MVWEKLKFKNETYNKNNVLRGYNEFETKIEKGNVFSLKCLQYNRTYRFYGTHNII